MVAAGKERDARDMLAQSIIERLELSGVGTNIISTKEVGEEVVKFASPMGASLVQAQDTLASLPEMGTPLKA